MHMLPQSELERDLERLAESVTRIAKDLELRCVESPDGIEPSVRACLSAASLEVLETSLRNWTAGYQAASNTVVSEITRILERHRRDVAASVARETRPARKLHEMYDAHGKPRDEDGPGEAALRDAFLGPAAREALERVDARAYGELDE